MSETAAAERRGPSVSLCVTMLLLAAVSLAVVSWLTVPWRWVPGETVHPVAARTLFSPRDLARSRAFSGLQDRILLTMMVLGLVVGLLLAFSPVGRWLWRRLPGAWPLRVAEATFVVVTAGMLVTLPLRWWAHARAVEFGLSTQDAAGWFGDRLSGLAITWVTTTLALVLLVGLARARPRTWPLWAGLAAAGLSFAAVFVYPVAVEPVFNHFRPMEPSRLRGQILHLAAREGVPVSNVLVADASRRTTSLNAYVSGFGSTRRIVLYDTTLRSLPDSQLRVLAAHELAHAKYDDMVTGTALAASGSVAGVAVLGLLGTRRRFLRAAGVEGMSDPRVVAAVLALASLGGLVTAPAQNLISRAVEARADVVSLRLTRDPTAFERMQVRLSRSSLDQAGEPRWMQLWFGSHPTTVERIGIARAVQRQQGGR